MTEKKIDKKVTETQKALKDQELDKVTGGLDDYPRRPHEDANGPKKDPKRNIIRPW